MDRLSGPVRYTGGEIANLDYHHGQLRPAVGVQHYQVLRANRSHPEWADGFGWTYNHAPMLAYWNETFYLEYLSDPVSEHVPPGQTLLVTSGDGIRWGNPRVVFPQYRLAEDVRRSDGVVLQAGTAAVMHQRMGFYVSPGGKLLALGFYGFCPTPKDKPNDGLGIGRVVREICTDGAFGPIYFIRYNRHAGWNEENTQLPFYKESPDAVFREACEALLADKPATLQWWEEDRSPGGYYAVEGQRALSYYRLSDGRIIGLWKSSKAAVSSDEGRTWSPVEDVPSLIMAGAKIWGQQTSDGNYALIYNPSPTGTHRWPLAIVTGKNGTDFDRLLLAGGEVAPRRYGGQHKDYGLNYVRGIEATNSIPLRGSLWITYSMNKEDIWVCEIPVPVQDRIHSHVREVFTDLESGGPVPGWNIYSPLWAPVTVEDFPSVTDKSLRLVDRDPYDYAKAERVFPESRRVEIRCKISAGQSDHGQLFIECCDGKSTASLRVVFDSNGYIRVLNQGYYVDVHPYEAGVWYDVAISVDAVLQNYELAIGGIKKKFRFFAPVLSVERITFRTGPVRREPHLETRVQGGDVGDGDEPVPEAHFYINLLETNGEEL
ncbi:MULTISPECIES: hypothetical protein [unclassified Paenibacillus]|uniref:hypothetical protein n=1 Tax=unclassified Paenibacillus TaxID=185978 RepID=UPI00362919E8